MSADDFQNFPSGSPDPSDTGDPTGFDPSTSFNAGNRPASGARRATPGEVLSQGFQGNQNAGDFLGLDLEFTGSQDAGGFGDPGDLSLQGAPTTYDPSLQTAYAPGDLGGFEVAPDPMLDPALDPAQGFADSASSFEYGHDLGADSGGDFQYSEPASGSGKRGLLLTVGLLGALGALGYYFGPQWLARFSGKTDQVATNVPTHSTTPRSTTGARPEGLPESGSSSALPEVGSQPIAAGPEAQVESSTPRPTGAKPPRLDPQPTPTATTDGATPPPAKGQESAPGDLLSGILGHAPAVPSQPSTFPNIEGAEFEWASDDQLELIWRGDSVPMEAVHAPAKTLMPRVGSVRVFMQSNEIFEGRLYAVGQDRVWIDTEPGRIGLDGGKVERILVIPASATVLGGGQGEMVATLGRRARVRVPGGMLYGNVLKVEGDDVTLQLEDGGRVHVQSSDIEDIGSGRAIVVRR